MISESKGDLTKGYYVAVYICVSVVLMMLVTLLFYVVCSKKFRLNWYEKSQLASVEDLISPPSSSSTSTVGSKDILSDVPAKVRRPLRSASTGQLDCALNEPQKSGEFWVPVGLQRQISMGPNELRFSGDGDNSPATPNTPLGIKISPFALAHMGMIADKGCPLMKCVQPVTAGSPTKRPRLTSMYSKLDHTKIDTTLYSQKETPEDTSISEINLGAIQFSVFYNTQFSFLCVRLLQARDLLARDFSGTADPYAKIRLLPDKTDVRQTKMHRNTLLPQFEEEFVFDLPHSELSERTLEILIYDYDQYSRHVCMGHVQLPLKSIDLIEEIVLWKEIQQCDDLEEKEDYGELMFSLGYLPSAERLTIVILKARNLRVLEETKKIPDPYVKVSLIQGNKRIKKKKTSTQRSTVNPIFNEALTFNITKEALKIISLELTVTNDNMIGPKEILGRIVIGPECKGDAARHLQEMFLSKSAVAMWHQLRLDENI